MRKYVVILNLAAIMLFVFTACGQIQDTPPPERVLVPDASVSQEPDYNTPTTTLRFYYHSTEIDPNIYALPEAFLYHAVEIPVENLREVFIGLMYEHI